MKKTTNGMRFETQVPLRDVMKNNPTMIGIEANVAMAAKAMCTDEVGSVIILENNKPTGIVTEEDITCKVVAKDLKPSTVQVREIMSTPLITVSAEKTVGDAAHMMVKHKVRRSRTVTIPMTFFFASITGSLLTLCFTIMCAASPTVFSALTVMSGVLMISLTCTVLGLRSFATTLQVMSSSVTIPVGLLFSRIITLPTSSVHIAFAAIATLASIPIMVGLFFITSRSVTWVSNRIPLVVFFMSHLLEVLFLMITISILPFTCINTIWRRQPAMQRSNMSVCR